MYHPTYIKINISKLKKNILAIKKKISPSLFCLPVKANAYGHGFEICKKIEDSVDYFATAHLSEALILKNLSIKKPILILGAIFKEQVPIAIKNDIEFTISSPYKANFLKNLPKIAKVHLEVDTGMQRTGMRPKTAKTVYKTLKKEKNVQIKGIYSHLATAASANSSFCSHQIKIFNDLVQEIDPEKKILSHLANSSGIEFYKNSYKNFSMVRCGILSYGYSLSEHFQKKVSPIFSLHSKVSFLKDLEKNQGISYQHTYVTKKPTKIATIPIGYGDGYKRSLSNKGYVVIKKKKYPIVGIICMDQLMVEVDDKINIEDNVTLIGKNIPLKTLSFLSDTIDYDVLVSFSNRIPRVHTT